MIITTSLLYAIHYVIKIVPVIAIGIFVTNFAVNLGLMKKFDGLIKPLSSRARISATSALAIVTCTFSSTTGHSMLSQAFDSKSISDREVIAVSLMTSFPGILSHMLTFFIPVVIPILGFTTGVIYVGLRCLVALLKTFLGIFLVRLWLTDTGSLPAGSLSPTDGSAGDTEHVHGPGHNPTHNSECDSAQTPVHHPVHKHAGNPAHAPTMDRKDAFNSSTRSTYKLLRRIAPVMFITLFITSIGFEMGVFESLSNVLDPITNLLGLESEIAMISATGLVNSYSEMVLAGSLLGEGMISVNGVLIALLLGNVISLSTRFAKHSLPLHVSLFGPKLGGKIVAVNGAATFAIDALIIAVLLLM
ncbi:MAG: hypothetical protein JRC86_00095 [Deltaproteobacteria bacterium]|nr:hypothetical protein [Deltaproteobacteria bacterium]